MQHYFFTIILDFVMRSSYPLHVVLRPPLTIWYLVIAQRYDDA
jgi:hypothetical protein